MRYITLILIGLTCMLSTSTFASEQAAALASLYCDAAQIKKIADGAIVDIRKMNTRGVQYKAASGNHPAKVYTIYRVILDTSKMPYTTLVVKMRKAGCYQAPKN